MEKVAREEKVNGNGKRERDSMLKDGKVGENKEDEGVGERGV